MSDDLNPAAVPQQRRRPRTRTITVASVAAAGLLSGGIIAATAASSEASAPASGSSSSSSNAAAKAPRPAAPNGNDIDGTVTEASSDSITVKSKFGTTRTYKVTDDTKVHRGKATVQASSLENGQRVHVRGTKSGSTYTATDVDVRAAHIGGVVATLADDSLTVTDDDGFTRTISTSSSTTYTKDGDKASRSDLKTGSVVRAEGTVASDGTTLAATSVDIQTKETAPRGPGAGGPGAGGPGAPGKGGPGQPGMGAPPAGKGKSGSKPSGAPAKPSGAPAKPSNAPSGAPSGAPSS